MFAKKNSNDRSKLKLTCMATGFFPKDVQLTIMKNQKHLPDDEIESTGVRPNHDGSYQMRKSVEVKEEEKAEYDCSVQHRYLQQPILIKVDEN
ncbi:MHC class I antigen [Labeo rohita]|uniref:MHC class I antigen n=1 Tax=Labeo rohita TaxID=84645 RepID=A0A498LGY4_LABRO|nr:MHC class I antigen [Labeo rohita]RXN07172.1 MHC class I antigen [Labeo rohita]